MATQFTLIIGPMFSGKSTYLLSFERRFLLTPTHSILVIKHVFDTVRYSATHVATHTGETSQTQSLNVSKLSEIPQALLEASDVILIDEGQFFDDLSEWVTALGSCSSKQKHIRHIVIAGLSGDYKQQNFKSITDVISQMDTIVHLKSTCSICGLDASFTTRTGGCTGDEQTLIGSSDVYQPRCRTHITLK